MAGLRTLQPNGYAAHWRGNWKATPKLTLNIGVRWDWYPVPTDPDGVLQSLRLDVLPRAADGRMLPTLVPVPNTKVFKLAHEDNRYIMPRVGIAWRLTDKWVIRTGGGWFANAPQLDDYQILGRQPPYGAAFTFQ